MQDGVLHGRVWPGDVGDDSSLVHAANRAGTDLAPLHGGVTEWPWSPESNLDARRILTTNHGKRIAVIQNEFGEDLGLGSALAAEGGGGEIFEECYEMNNGRRLRTLLLSMYSISCPCSVMNFCHLRVLSHMGVHPTRVCRTR